MEAMLTVHVLIEWNAGRGKEGYDEYDNPAKRGLFLAPKPCARCNRPVRAGWSIGTPIQHLRYCDRCVRVQN